MKRPYQIFFKVMTLIYLGGAAFFISLYQFLEKFLKLAPSAHAFWVILGVSMMTMLAFLSWRASGKNVSRDHFYLHLISKATSIVLFFLFFLTTSHVGYCVGAVVDLGVFLMVYRGYRVFYAH